MVFGDCISGRDDLLERGSSSHICGGDMPVSAVEETSQISPTDCSRTLLAAPWLRAGEGQAAEDGPAAAV
jgi:hypothetical protein